MTRQIITFQLQRKDYNSVVQQLVSNMSERKHTKEGLYYLSIDLEVSNKVLLRFITPWTKNANR